MRNKFRSTLIATSLLLAPGAAAAHVMLMPSSATAGASTLLQFHVEHGCGELATTALRVEIPAAIGVVLPSAKSGWSLASEGHAIVWRGASPGAHVADSFEMKVTLPAAPGAIFFPVTQTCGATVENWSEIPDPGHTPLKRPAPSLTVVAADGTGK